MYIEGETHNEAAIPENEALSEIAEVHEHLNTQMSEEQSKQADAIKKAKSLNIAKV